MELSGKNSIMWRMVQQRLSTYQLFSSINCDSYGSTKVLPATHVAERILSLNIAVSWRNIFLIHIVHVAAKGT